MQKHDKMVALAKEKSAEMTETAITAIESMYRKNEKISVAELTKLTGLSRGIGDTRLWHLGVFESRISLHQSMMNNWKIQVI